MKNLNRITGRPLIFFACAYVLGVISEGQSMYIICICTLLIIAAGVIFFSPSDGRERRRINLRILFLLGFSVVFLLFGLGRAAEANVKSELKVTLQRKEKASVTGVVSGISEKSDAYLFYLDNSYACFGDKNHYSKGITVSIEEPGDIEHGDFICVQGTLYPHIPATNRGQFDADLYYSCRNEDAVIYADYAEIIKKDAEDSLLIKVKRLLFFIRGKLRQELSEILPEKQSGVMKAMLLGEKDFVDDEIMELYSNNGIAHILAISGLHVSLIGMGLYRLVLKLTGILKAAIIITVTVMLMYGILTGFSVSTVRAVIMLTVLLFAHFAGRVYDAPSALALAAIIILIYQPMYIYDCGFKLSFTAVMGILTANTLIKKLSIRSGIFKSFFISGFAQLFTMPVVMADFMFVTPYSIIINMIILPLMSAVVVCGFLAVGISATGVITPGIAAGAVYYILDFFERVCRFASEIPFCRIITGEPQLCSVIIFWLAVAVGCGSLMVTGKRSFLLVLMLCGVIFIPQSRGELYMAFLDVGQGDCIFFEAGGHSYLIDGGSSDISGVGSYRIVPFINSLGYDSVDTVIITHPDSDHVNGISEIMKEKLLDIGELLLPVNMKPEEEELALLAKEQGINVSYIQAGDRLGNSVADIVCLNPASGENYGTKNSYSTVFSVSCGNFDVILTGDVEGRGETVTVDKLDEYLLPDKYELLKVAHHGSDYSTKEALLCRLNADFAIISCGRNNRYGHPGEELLERLGEHKITYFETMRHGMLEVRVRRGNKFSLTTYCRR